MSATLAAFSAFLSIFSSFLSPVANKKTSFAHQARRPLSHPARLRWTLSRTGRHQRSSAIQLWGVSISGAVLQCSQRAANQLADRRGTRGLGRGQLDVTDGFAVAFEQSIGVGKADATRQAEVDALALRRDRGEDGLHVGAGRVLDHLPPGIDLLGRIRHDREDRLAGLAGDLAYLRGIALEEGTDRGTTGFRI